MLSQHTASSGRSTLTGVLSGLTIFLSAFLVFSVEPLIAKRILPWYGGSAAVWSTCLVFYQVALLLGYLYARLIIRLLPRPLQTVTHIAVLLASLALLPVGPGERWSELNSSPPAWSIFAMLTVTLGLPFVTLSATTPLVQHWLAQAGDPAPFRFFALSNLASLSALVSYPLAIEPTLTTNFQRAAWSYLYVAFVVLCTSVALKSRRASGLPESYTDEHVWILPTRKLAWFSLSASGSMLLLSVTNHMQENVAAVPLLWVLPLSAYLLTFVVAFSSMGQFLNRSIGLRLLAFALGIMGYSIYEVNAVHAIQISLPIFLGCLFVCCLFCHTELVRLRPAPVELSSFYLVMAAGGAIGAVLIGLVAPSVFRGVYELPVTLLVVAGLVTVLTWADGAWPVRLLWMGVSACMVAVVMANVHGYRENTLALRRSFYGSLRVVQSRHAGPEQTRTLFHGTIEHGSQYLLPPMRLQPTTYYSPESGIGIVLRECFTGHTRVGVVGLGAGTLAAYGRAGDTYRFFELNGQVIDIAKTLFSYLGESKAAIEIVPGDARLSILHDRSPAFDVIALDAFSGDAIPVHLLTREAIDIYRAHLSRGGVLAFHVSNDFLDLAPVVKQLADSVHMQTILVRNHENSESGVLAADWVLVTNTPAVLDNPGIRVHALAIPEHPSLRVWTDGYNNLLQIVKRPVIR